MSLFTTIPELKDYIVIDANTKMATVNPSLKDAERRYIKPLLGDYYHEFVIAYNESKAEPPTALDDDEKAILPFIQSALAKYTAYGLASLAGIRIGDNGIQEVRSGDNQPAPKWKVRDIQVEYFKNADQSADELLAFLEEHADNATYAAWYNDEVANTRMSGAIVYSTAIAAKHIDIGESRRLFLRLKKFITRIESQHIPKLISNEQYTELIQQLKGDTVTDENRALIELLEPIIAKRALYFAIPFIKVSISNDGIHLVSSSDSVLKQELASKEDIEALRCALENDTTGYKADESQLRQFILDHIDDYPLIKASAVYTVQPDPGPTWQTINDPENKHFGV